jgi:hypothetical protein
MKEEDIEEYRDVSRKIKLKLNSALKYKSNYSWHQIGEFISKKEAEERLKNDKLPHHK